MSKPTVAIIGASADRSKYGNKAVRAHIRQGYDVYPVHPKAEEIEGLTAYAALVDVPVAELDRITIYVPPQTGLELLEEIKAKPAKEIFFNPGSESEAIRERAAELDLHIIEACSIVDIGVHPDQLAETME